MLRCLICVIALLLACIPAASANSMEYEELYFDLLGLTGGPESDAGFTELPMGVQNLYLAAILDMEIQNGGLLQYFANCGPESASRVSESLRAIGLEPIAALYDAFLSDHQIDPNDLSAFSCETAEDFSALYRRYPEADAFDDAYMQKWQALNFNAVMLAYAAENLQ